MSTENGERIPLFQEVKENFESLWDRRRILVILSILFVELCERLAFYSVVANLIMYCTSVLQLQTPTATTVSLVFSGTVYMLAVTGGYVADAYAGKYRTIVGSSVVYILGLCSFFVSAYDDFYNETHDEKVPTTRSAFFYMGLALVAVAAGGIKASVMAFGADQVSDRGPKAVRAFFLWFYWFINIGSFTAYVGVAYVQQHISFAYGYVIPLVFMISALVIFVLLKRRYVIIPPAESVIFDVAIITFKANLFNFQKLRKSNGGMFSDEMVDGVISVLRTLPVFSLLLMYWAVYSQSERMDAHISEKHIIPVAVIQVFNTVMVLILIPVVDRVIYPVLEKRGHRPTHLQRMGVGLVLSVISVFVAGGLAISRKNELRRTGGIVQTLNDQTFNASTISIFAQVPQFALIGASEVSTSISGLEFNYNEAPEFMQGLLIGIYLMIQGIGSYLSTAILAIVTHVEGSWYPDEINNGKTEYVFFLFGGLMAVNTVIFAIVAKYYKHKPTRKHTKSINCDNS